MITWSVARVALDFTPLIPPCPMHLLFDLDGTLTNSQLGITACIRHAFQQLGQPLPGTALTEWIGPPLQESFTTALGCPERAAEAVGLYRDRFATVVTVDQVAAGKPAPDIFLLAAQRLGVAPHQCLVLEDSNAGVQAAQAAGMAVVMVPDLQQPTAASQAIAQPVLGSLHEVLAWLQSL